VIADPIDNLVYTNWNPIKRRRLRGATQRQKQIGQRPVTPAWHAYRKELRAYSGLRWNQADDFAWMENLNKRFKLAAAFYNLSQLIAQTLRNWNAQATRRLRAAAFPPTHLPFGRHSPNSSPK